ncbi:MAG: aspartate kinase [Bacteroidia bacterium]|nr:aspartate kinase [Bacteroidia bacterium]
MLSNSPYNEDICAMLVMKFGGASVKNADAVRNVGYIIRQFADQPLIVVISAMDKTTNQLEKLARWARDCDETEAWAQFSRIREFHYEIVYSLGLGEMPGLKAQLEGYFQEIERIIRGLLLLGEFPSRTYDRIVSYGEMLSTAIVCHHLQQADVAAHFLDVRDIIKTDTTYTQARVIWSQTEANIKERVLPLLEKHGILITQGFIASSMEGKITTLGREGSDYTASIFAHCLEASRLIVWKDVKGVLNADPRRNPGALKHDHLTYEQAVEMTFYGATVIHPKTIKPLYARQIPLEVKCFLDLNESGTRIAAFDPQVSTGHLTSTIVKEGQVLLRISSRDFSFMKTSLVSEVFRWVSHAGAQVNLVQTTAISLNLCLDFHPDAIRELESLLMDQFHVEVEKDLVLTTYLNRGTGDLDLAENAAMVQQIEDKLFVLQRGN